MEGLIEVNKIIIIKTLKNVIYLLILTSLLLLSLVRTLLDVQLIKDEHLIFAWVLFLIMYIFSIAIFRDIYISELGIHTKILGTERVTKWENIRQVKQDYSHTYIYIDKLTVFNTIIGILHLKFTPVIIF